MNWTLLFAAVFIIATAFIDWTLFIALLIAVPIAAGIGYFLRGGSTSDGDGADNHHDNDSDNDSDGGDGGD